MMFFELTWQKNLTRQICSFSARAFVTYSNKYCSPITFIVLLLQGSAAEQLLTYNFSWLLYRTFSDELVDEKTLEIGQLMQPYKKKLVGSVLLERSAVLGVVFNRDWDSVASQVGRTDG